ncbi:UbiA family prenyltransferase [Thalassolituus sp. C2-1]|uniref:UbiA family prenyltransferase n=1 Tax=Venatorbacter sp. C2-1 TaxID=2597518 RepID=UPI0011907EE1|nr:UbiA family prenyltransferase [Thalassolituus sp. C2-1]TVV45398.1 prenyltransferase [Thalassolituus sp. C2-1]
MTNSAVIAGEPLLRRIRAWMDERFPFANALLFFILYLVTASVVRASQGEWFFNWSDIVSCLITWSLFLTIRIFDEHKDYELDVKNHPQRVLQSGRITLTHLKGLGIIAVIAQLLWSLFLGTDTLIVWAVMFVYLCLMGAEFFCGAWLEKRLLLYALSHMAIMPLIVLWLAAMAQPQLPVMQLLNSAPLMAMMSLAFISGFCFEITRKTRGPEEERETVDSYSRILGVQGAANLVIALVCAMVVNQLVLLWLLDVAVLVVYAVLLVLVLVLALKAVFKFKQSPHERGRENNEKAVALTMLLGYLVVIIAAALNIHLLGAAV